MDRVKLEKGDKVVLYSCGDGSAAHCYSIDECIGMGAGCIAYRAADENGIPVKLKHFCPKGLRRGRASYASAEERFLEAYNNQIRMMNSEDSANVTAGLFGLFRDGDGSLWTAVQSMAGRTMDKVLPELSLNGVFRIIGDIAESIAAYHRDGWILMDLKPENILVIDSPGLRGVNFFDFDSFIKQEDILSALNGGQGPALSATADFSAPELLGIPVSYESITPLCDVYSVGAIVYYSVYGKVPDADCGIPGAVFDFSAIPERLRRELSPSAAAMLERFLRRTLSLSPESRYGSDEELLKALEMLIGETDSLKPRLRHILPVSTPNFSGRTAELKQLSHLLNNKVSPVFVCGAAGIGKTELVLKAAELTPGSDFYLATYAGDLKTTIANLPADNIPEGSEDERYSCVTEMLRSAYTSETVIIIDSFDISCAEAEALFTDSVFQELMSLAVRFVFTSRRSIQSVNTIAVERMGNSELKRMMRRNTDTSEQNLDIIVSLTDGHTMTLDMISRLISSGYSNLGPEQIIKSLRRTNNTMSDRDIIDEYRKAFLRLAGIFSKSRFSASEAQILSFSSMFPEHGISSPCLRCALNDSELNAAERLASEGWLRFNPGSGFWSVHPLVREIICSDKTSSPSKRRVEKFIAALKEAEKDGSKSKSVQLSELNSLYGAFVRLKDPVKASPVITAAALCVLALIGFFVLKKTGLTAGIQNDSGPYVTVTLKAPEADPETVAQDAVILKERLSLLLDGAEVKASEDGSLEALCPLSALGNSENQVDIIDVCVSRPIALSFVYADENNNYVNLPISRSDILSAVLGESVGLVDIQPADGGFSAEQPYVVITLKENPAEELQRIYADGFRPMLAHDYMLAAEGAVENCYVQENLFALDDGVSYAVVYPEWDAAGFCDSIIYSYCTEETRLVWQADIKYDRSSLWLSAQSSSAEEESAAPEDNPPAEVSEYSSDIEDIMEKFPSGVEVPKSDSLLEEGRRMYVASEYGKLINIMSASSNKSAKLGEAKEAEAVTVYAVQNGYALAIVDSTGDGGWLNMDRLVEEYYGDRPGPSDTLDVKKGVMRPTNDQFFDEYRYFTVKSKNGSSTIVYMGPKTSSKKLTTIGDGEEVTGIAVCGNSTFVRKADGTLGWIQTKYLEPITE